MVSDIGNSSSPKGRGKRQAMKAPVEVNLFSYAYGGFGFGIWGTSVGEVAEAYEKLQIWLKMKGLTPGVPKKEK